MNLIIVWEAVVLVITGILLLRVVGRKSVAHMTLPQTMVMVSIGTIIAHPIVEHSVIKAIIVGGVFVVTLVIIEYLQVKFNGLEKFLTGKSRVVIENGMVKVDNLKKLRLTVDQLEMQMRNKGLTNYHDIKIGTIEPNGQLGYELNDDAKPLTVGQFKQMMATFATQNPTVPSSENETVKKEESNIFQEINKPNKGNPPFLK